jgi:hypothetical protein
MYRVLLVFWLSLPVVVIAWHLGPGRYQLAADQAGTHIRAAEAAKAKAKWLDMADAYARAAAALSPQSITERRRLLLAAAVGRITGGQRAEGQQELQQLLDDMQADQNADDQLLAAVRHEMATADYQTAWIMRLNGAPDDEWKPRVVQAQRQFRQLAEAAQRRALDIQDPRNFSARPNADVYKKNLEAAIYLEQMDLSRLKAIPLPAHLQSLVKSDAPEDPPAADAETPANRRHDN